MPLKNIADNASRRADITKARDLYEVLFQFARGFHILASKGLPGATDTANMVLELLGEHFPSLDTNQISKILETDLRTILKLNKNIPLERKNDGSWKLTAQQQKTVELYFKEIARNAFFKAMDQDKAFKAQKAEHFLKTSGDQLFPNRHKLNHAAPLLKTLTDEMIDLHKQKMFIEKYKNDPSIAMTISADERTILHNSLSLEKRIQSVASRMFALRFGKTTGESALIKRNKQIKMFLQNCDKTYQAFYRAYRDSSNTDDAHPGFEKEIIKHNKEFTEFTNQLENEISALFKLSDFELQETDAQQETSRKIRKLNRDWQKQQHELKAKLNDQQISQKTFNKKFAILKKQQKQQLSQLLPLLEDRRFGYAQNSLNSFIAEFRRRVETVIDRDPKLYDNLDPRLLAFFGSVRNAIGVMNFQEIVPELISIWTKPDTAATTTSWLEKGLGGLLHSQTTDISRDKQFLNNAVDALKDIPENGLFFDPSAFSPIKLPLDPVASLDPVRNLAPITSNKTRVALHTSIAAMLETSQAKLKLIDQTHLVHHKNQLKIEAYQAWVNTPTLAENHSASIQNSQKACFDYLSLYTQELAQPTAEGQANLQAIGEQLFALYAHALGLPAQDLTKKLKDSPIANLNFLLLIAERREANIEKTAPNAPAEHAMQSTFIKIFSQGRSQLRLAQQTFKTFEQHKQKIQNYAIALEKNNLKDDSLALVELQAKLKISLSAYAEFLKIANQQTSFELYQAQFALVQEFSKIFGIPEETFSPDIKSSPISTFDKLSKFLKQISVELENQELKQAQQNKAKAGWFSAAGLMSNFQSKAATPASLKLAIMTDMFNATSGSFHNMKAALENSKNDALVQNYEKVLQEPSVSADYSTVLYDIQNKCNSLVELSHSRLDHQEIDNSDRILEIQQELLKTLAKVTRLEPPAIVEHMDKRSPIKTLEDLKAYTAKLSLALADDKNSEPLKLFFQTAKQIFSSTRKQIITLDATLLMVKNQDLQLENYQERMLASPHEQSDLAKLELIKSSLATLGNIYELGSDTFLNSELMKAQQNLITALTDVYHCSAADLKPYLKDSSPQTIQALLDFAKLQLATAKQMVEQDTANRKPHAKLALSAQQVIVQRKQNSYDLAEAEIYKTFKAATSPRFLNSSTTAKIAFDTTTAELFKQTKALAYKSFIAEDKEKDALALKASMKKLVTHLMVDDNNTVDIEKTSIELTEKLKTLYQAETDLYHHKNLQATSAHEPSVAQLFSLLVDLPSTGDLSENASRMAKQLLNTSATLGKEILVNNLYKWTTLLLQLQELDKLKTDHKGKLSQEILEQYQQQQGASLESLQMKASDLALLLEQKHQLTAHLQGYLKTWTGIEIILPDLSNALESPEALSHYLHDMLAKLPGQPQIPKKRIQAALQDKEKFRLLIEADVLKTIQKSGGSFYWNMGATAFTTASRATQWLGYEKITQFLGFAGEAVQNAGQSNLSNFLSSKMNDLAKLGIPSEDLQSLWKNKANFFELFKILKEMHAKESVKTGVSAYIKETLSKEENTIWLKDLLTTKLGVSIEDALLKQALSSSHDFKTVLSKILTDKLGNIAPKTINDASLNELFNAANFKLALVNFMLKVQQEKTGVALSLTSLDLQKFLQAPNSVELSKRFLVESLHKHVAIQLKTIGAMNIGAMDLFSDLPKALSLTQEKMFGKFNPHAPAPTATNWDTIEKWLHSVPLEPWFIEQSVGKRGFSEAQTTLKHASFNLLQEFSKGLEELHKTKILPLNLHKFRNKIASLQKELICLETSRSRAHQAYSNLQTAHHARKSQATLDSLRGEFEDSKEAYISQEASLVQHIHENIQSFVGIAHAEPSKNSYLRSFIHTLSGAQAGVQGQIFLLTRLEAAKAQFLDKRSQTLETAQNMRLRDPHAAAQSQKDAFGFELEQFYYEKIQDQLHIYKPNKKEISQIFGSVASESFKLYANMMIQQSMGYLSQFNKRLPDSLNRDKSLKAKGAAALPAIVEIPSSRLSYWLRPLQSLLARFASLFRRSTPVMELEVLAVAPDWWKTSKPQDVSPKAEQPSQSQGPATKHRRSMLNGHSLHKGKISKSNVAVIKSSKHQPKPSG